MAATLDSAPSFVNFAEPLFIYDIATLINAAFQQNIEPTQAGRVPKRISNKLAPQLQGRERLTYDDTDAYLEMIFAVLQKMHIVQVVKPPFSTMKARIEPGPLLGTWSQMDTAGQIRSLLENYTSNRQWMDIPSVNYQPNSWTMSYYYTDIVSGRKALLEQLSTCTTSQWYTVESLLQQLWKDKPLAFRTQNSYMSKAEQRKFTADQEGWLASEGALYIGMLESSLFEFGLVTLGYQTTTPEDIDESDPYAFMLTDLGASALSKATPTTSGDQSRSLIVQPNFDLLLLQPDLPTLYSILPFTQANQIGLVSNLKLTSTSLLRGLAAGKSIDQIIQILTDHTQKELPQNVLYTLQDWAKQYKEIRISQILLLELPSEAVANQLCSIAKFQKFAIRQLTPTLLAVNGDTNLQELKNALDKEGIMARLSGNFHSSTDR